LRLVLQPLYVANGQTFAHDIAIHAFYPIATSDLARVVGELRALGSLQNTPLDAPLQVSRALMADPKGDYTTRLRKLVLRYARADRVVRLTVIGQNAGSAAFAWIMRGIEVRDAGWTDMTIPEVGASKQSVLLAGGDTVYSPDPGADSPAGFAFAINGA